MYARHFGFTEKPFNITPDPRFFYSNRIYQEAYATLLYGILERKGFIVLTGEVGTGKTTLLRRLMNDLDATAKLVFFYNTTLTFDELVHFTCAELELKVDDLARVQRLQALNDLLIREATRGGTVVLLVDEAQNLSPEVLENLRLISNLETSTQKLLQIVLVGQPELETKLENPALRQVAQRVAIRYRLERLDDDEVERFIHHRLRVAGREPPDVFTRDAVLRIARYSTGLPRLINILCDNALLIAYASEARRVTGEMVEEAAADLGLARHMRPPDAPRPAAMRPARVPTRWAGQVAALAGVAAAAGLVTFVVTTQAERLRPMQARLAALLGRVASSDTFAPAASSPPAASPAPSMPARPGVPGEAQEHPDGAPEAAASAATDVPSPSASPPARASEPTTSTPPDDDGTHAADAVVRVPRGATVSELVFARYGGWSPLALDVIKELNPHIENLDHVVVGERVKIPPFTLSTLLRRQPDGSYHLILASLTRRRDAERLLDVVRGAGYDAAVTARPVSAQGTIYRIAIRGLPSPEAAARAWSLAQANGWSNAPSERGLAVAREER